MVVKASAEGVARPNKKTYEMGGEMGAAQIGEMGVEMGTRKSHDGYTESRWGSRWVQPQAARWGSRWVQKDPKRSF